MKVSETVSAAQKCRSPLQQKQQEPLKAEVKADGLIPLAFSMVFLQLLPSVLPFPKMGCFSFWHFVSYAAALHPAWDGKSMSPANTMVSAVLSSFLFVGMHFEMNSENKLGS